MSGFAPLIEGFLAYALTMLALATGVSSIVGALHHLRRRHARGLRDMVRLLYVRELKPLLGDEWLGKFRHVEPGPPPPEVAEGGLVTTILQRTKAIVLDVRSRYLKVFAKASTFLMGKKPTEQENALIARRADFIYDMTFMPVPDVVEKLAHNASDYWRKKLVSSERLVGAPWYTTLLHPKRVGRRWQTLRYSLEGLKDEEFHNRLGASDVGKELKRLRETDPGLPSWDELAAGMLKQFQTIGGASSETFARHSRGWSVVVGFLLAVFLNVDSLDLLNSYMTDPALRQQVIERSDSIVAQQPQAPSADGATTLGPARERLGATSTQLADTAKGLKSSVDALASTLATDEARRLAATLQSGLQGVVERFDEVRTNLGEVDKELTEAEQKIRGVTSSLATSFPIGWKRFPNCSTTSSADLRCGGRVFQQSTQQNPWWHRFSNWMGVTLPEPLSALWAPVLGASSTLAAARSEETAAFYQWEIGVLLTGLLLGLGTPFWVQAVSAAFNLRRWTTKEDEKKKDETK